MSAFVLSYDEIAPYVENYAAYVDEEVESAAENAGSWFWDTITQLSYKAPENEVDTSFRIEPEIANDNEIIEEFEEGVATLVDDKEFKIKVPVELDADAQTIVQMVENAVNSGKGMEEIQKVIDADQLIKNFGISAYLDALPYIQELVKAYQEYTTTGFTGPVSNGSLPTPWKVTAGGNFGPQTGYYHPETATTGTQEAETIDYNQMEGSVRNGATSANAGIIDELQTIVQRLNSLLAKEWKVNINPTSTMGAMNSAAAAAWGKVNG